MSREKLGSVGLVLGDSCFQRCFGWRSGACVLSVFGTTSLEFKKPYCRCEPGVPVCALHGLDYRELDFPKKRVERCVGW